MTREQQLTLIYRHTHRDYKGRREDGTRCILIFEPGVGTCSVPLEALTEAQIADKLSYALRCEEKAEGRMIPRFSKTFCSQCGRAFGPGDSGFSHCEDHAPMVECPSCRACRDHCRLCDGTGEVTEQQAQDWPDIP